MKKTLCVVFCLVSLLKAEVGYELGVYTGYTLSEMLEKEEIGNALPIASSSSVNDVNEFKTLVREIPAIVEQVGLDERFCGVVNNLFITSRFTSGWNLKVEIGKLLKLIDVQKELIRRENMEDNKDKVTALDILTVLSNVLNNTSSFVINNAINAPMIEIIKGAGNYAKSASSNGLEFCSMHKTELIICTTIIGLAILAKTNPDIKNSELFEHASKLISGTEEDKIDARNHFSEVARDVSYVVVEHFNDFKDYASDLVAKKPDVSKRRGTDVGLCLDREELIKQAEEDKRKEVRSEAKRLKKFEEDIVLGEQRKVTLGEKHENIEKSNEWLKSRHLKKNEAQTSMVSKKLADIREKRDASEKKLKSFIETKNSEETTIEGN